MFLYWINSFRPTFSTLDYWFEIGKVLTGKLLFKYYSMIGTILNPLIHGFSSDLMNIYQCWGGWYGTKAIDSNRFWWYLLYGLHRLSTVFSKHLRNSRFWFFRCILPENKLITRTWLFPMGRNQHWYENFDQSLSNYF